MFGDKHTYDRLIHEIVHGARAAVVFVDFARSPEARYPVPIEEAYTATTWMAEHGRMVNVDATRLAVVGV